MGLFNRQFDYQVLSTTVMGAVNDIFTRMCSERFSQEPTITTDLAWLEEENQERLKVSGFDKHLGQCFISVVHYYMSTRHMEKDKPCGVMTLYTKQATAAQLLSSLGFLKLEKVNENVMSDMCGEFCNVIAGSFKGALASLGYADLVMSAPGRYVNGVPGGLVFDPKIEKCHQFDFYMWGERAFIIDVLLSPIPMVRKV